MEDFIEDLRRKGYSENTLGLYRRVLKHFSSFLSLYGYSPRNFSEDEFRRFFLTFYRTEKSFETAVSVVRKYLKFVGVERVLDSGFPGMEEFREFRFISDEDMEKLRRITSGLRLEYLKLSVKLILHLGLSPSEVARLKASSPAYFGGLRIIEEGKIKRIIIDSALASSIFKLKENKLPGDPLLPVKPTTLKVTFHRILKKAGVPFTLGDFLDNYVARLLKLGFPVDMVVEYSGESLERVSYISRVLTLKSKAEIMENIAKRIQEEENGRL